MADQNATMKFLTRVLSRQRQFVECRQAADLGCDRCRHGLAAIECQQVQPRECEVPTTPGDINTNHVYISAGGLGETRYRVEEVFEVADVARVRIILPAMNINEKHRTFSLVDHFESGLYL